MENNWRILKLTHEEVELIEIALEMHGVRISRLSRESFTDGLISKQMRDDLFKISLEHMDLKYLIGDGQKDV